MLYNKAELTAMLMIADKLNWHKPALETIQTITQMVHNQQSLELDTVAECDDFEETLLSIALWDTDKIISTLFVNDYPTLVEYYYHLFLEDMGITDSDYKAMLDYHEALPERIEQEELDRHLVEELEWYNHARQIGWE